jgi:cell division protein FtsZ
MLEFAEESAGPKIKVVGVGGGGGNAVNTMIDGGIQGVDFIAANTDAQVLETNLAPIKVQLGRNLTRGLGAGANPEIGAAAAIEDAARLGEALKGADMVFVTAGMGGGTGTGAAPVIAQVARDLGALTVGVVTKPFVFEGMQRKKKASNGIEALAKSVDALIVIPNDRLVALASNKMTLSESFRMVDGVCLNAVRGISDLVMVPGLINVDFADVRTIMTGQGRALMGSGRGTGEKRAIEAAQMAINSPLLEDVSINGATGILVNITGGPDLTLSEVNDACGLIQEAADPEANIIFGSVIDPNAGDEVRITVIATGFAAHKEILVQAPAATGRTKRPADGQMALPMAPGSKPPPPSAAPMSTSASPPAFPPAASAQPPAYYYGSGPVAQPVCSLEPSDEVDISTGPYPAGGPWGQPLTHVPVAAGQVPAQAQGQEWAERPVIRPAVNSPMGPTPTRRTPGNVMAAASFEELGIEDSELDAPTFMRRRTNDGMQAAPSGYRTPSDK